MEEKEKKIPELLEDLGRKFPTENSKEKKRYGLYKCPFCNKEFEAITGDIKSGKQKSCGCLNRRPKTHGLTNHRLYQTWNGMMNRCYNINTVNYINYGGKGISVCKRWHNIENFIEDMYSSFEEGLTLDRINVDGNYEMENCRWTDTNTQAQNTRKIMSTNTSGYRGVSWHKGAGKWIVRIVINYKEKYLGCFTDLEDGVRAYDQYIIDNNLEHTKNFDY